MTLDEASRTTYVLQLFDLPGGIACRVTDVATREAWFVSRGAILRTLLLERRILTPAEKDTHT